MQQPSPARLRFQALIRRPESRLDLCEAALCIAWEDQGGPNPQAALQALDALADGVRLRLGGAQDAAARVATLNMYLFEELGFHGNISRYNDPANSFLDRVLERRTGLPITLSLLYMELGRRLGLPIRGVALPGHFIVRYAGPAGDIYIDPFNQGRLWSRDECEHQIIAAYGEQALPLIKQIMAPPSKHDILVRMLRNLKNAYVEAADYAHALRTVERILMLDQDNPQELRDRGLLRMNLGLAHLALDDLDHYAQVAPDAADLPTLRMQVRSIVEFVSRLN